MFLMPGKSSVAGVGLESGQWFTPFDRSLSLSLSLSLSATAAAYQVALQVVSSVRLHSTRVVVVVGSTLYRHCNDLVGPSCSLLSLSNQKLEEQPITNMAGTASG